MARPKKIHTKHHERQWHEGTVKEISPGVWRAWRAREHQPGGKSRRPSRTFRGPDAAQDAALWARGEPQTSVMYLGQWLERWLALVTPTIEPSTLRNYQEAVDACESLVLRPLAEISPDDWQELTNSLLKRWSRYHVKVWRVIISTALRTAIPDHLARNPLAAVRLPKPPEAEPRAWRQDEVDRLLAAAEGGRHEPWLLFMLGTGIRLGESRALFWEDVDLKSKTATIRASTDWRTNKRGPTKTKRIRVVDIADEVIPLLADHAKRQAPGTQLVFGYGKRAYVASTFREWLKRVCLAAKVRRLPVHSLRHTYASLAFDERVPVQDVARQLGHSVKTCLTTYSHYIGDGQRRSARAIGKALRHRFSGPKRTIGTHNGTRETV